MFSVTEREIEAKIGEKVKNLKSDFLMEMYPFQKQMIPYQNVALSFITS